jgi:hypothetical protein
MTCLRCQHTAKEEPAPSVVEGMGQVSIAT